jgi:hypothetical protein
VLEGHPLSDSGSLAAEGTRDVRQLVSACRAFKEHVSWGAGGGCRDAVQAMLSEHTAVLHTRVLGPSIPRLGRPPVVR